MKISRWFQTSLAKKNMSKTSKSHNRPRRDENLSGLSWFLKINSMPPPGNEPLEPQVVIGDWKIKNKFSKGVSEVIWRNSKCKNSQCHYPVRSLDRRSHLLNNLPSRMDSAYFQNPEIGGEQFQHQWFTNQNITSELCIDRFHCALGMPNAWAQVFAVALSKASHEPTSHGCDTCHKSSRRNRITNHPLYVENMENCVSRHESCEWDQGGPLKQDYYRSNMHMLFIIPLLLDNSATLLVDPWKFQLINHDQLLLHEKMLLLQGGNHKAAYGTVGLGRSNSNHLVLSSEASSGSKNFTARESWGKSWWLRQWLMSYMDKASKARWTTYI